MVTITLVASSLLVGGFAYLVADKITNILLDNATADVRHRLENGADYADRARSASTPSRYEPKLQDTIDDTVDYLAGGDPQQIGGVVVAMTADSFTDAIEPRTSPRGRRPAD